jgi:hypothetical protein
MSVLLLGTALVGFVCSAVLLRLGLGSMAVRYSIAVLVAYGGFLLLLRAWIAWRLHGRSELDPLDVVDIADVASDLAKGAAKPDVPSFGGGHFGGGGAGGSFDVALADSSASALAADASGDGLVSSAGEGVASSIVEVAGDADDAWPLVLAIALLTSVVVAAGLLVYAAPVLFAEVILDAAIVGGLMRRLRGVEPQSWAIGAIRKTWLVAVGLAIVLGVVGWTMQVVVPGAQSLGDVLRAS